MGVATRTTLALAALSAWLVLLMTGVALGGAIHLLLAAALGVFPWRSALLSDDEGRDAPPGGSGPGD